MSKVVIVKCVVCLKPYNINCAVEMGNTPQCPHCKCYGMPYEEIIALQPEIKEQLKETK